MSITLNAFNTQAFQAAVRELEQTGRAAVLHPTGTGKSCIAWNVIRHHPQMPFLWLAAGPERLALRQAELIRYAGSLPANVRFCDCSQLANATPEQWVALGSTHPGCILLDCYSELSAVCWARTVQPLLRLCPQAWVLGLNAPGAQPPCRAAQELFSGHVVSEVTVAQAMALGVLPVPAGYAALLWPQEAEMDLLQARIKNLCLPRGEEGFRVQYEELSRSLRQVENPTVLLPRLLTDLNGRYLVLLESADYAARIGPRLRELLQTTEAATRFYEADHACFADSAAVQAFRADTAPGPKVLLCINAPGVQQALGELAGILLVRQTTEFTVFKQMLCRGFAASGGQSVPVFDLVARFDGLGNGRTLQHDCTEAMTRAGSTAPGFRQEKPMQQSYRLYGRLRREMDARWDLFARAAAEAARREGTLELPRTYLTADGLPLGRWLEVQRQVQAGQRPGRLTAEQAARLEKLGIRWNHRLETAWEKGFAAAQKYRTDHGDLLVPVRFRDRTGFALGEWIVYNRQRYLTGSLSRERIERLEALGMVWNTASDLWEQSYAAAAQYYLEHGDLEIPIKYQTPSGFALGVWLGSQRAAYKAGELTAHQVERLNALKLDWTNRNDRKWYGIYEAAMRYHAAHGDLNVPSEYVTPDGILLGKWVARQRYAWLNPERSSVRVTPERKELLDKLGMVWEKPDPWDERYALALAYKQSHGSLNLPANYKTEHKIRLGSWLARQRAALRTGDSSLSPERRKALNALFQGEASGRRRARAEISVRESNWEQNYRAAARFAKAHGHLLVPASYTDAGGLRLGIWISNLRAARRNRPDSFQVTPDHIRRLDSLGMVWDAREAKWAMAYQEAAAYAAAHGSLNAPASYKSDSGFCLGDWLRRMREWNAAGDEKLTAEHKAKLDALGMVW